MRAARNNDGALAIRRDDEMAGLITDLSQVMVAIDSVKNFKSAGPAA